MYMTYKVAGCSINHAQHAVAKRDVGYLLSCIQTTAQLHEFAICVGESGMSHCFARVEFRSPHYVWQT